MPNPTNRVVIWIDPEAAIVAHDDGSPSTIIRRVDVEVGNTILGIGRLGTASDGEILGVTDRLIAAFTELRNEAARRLSERGGPQGTTPDGGTVCQSPICPRQAITHFAGSQGCSVAVAHPPTVLRTVSADRPRKPLEHDEELHSGHDNPGASFAGCPACDAAWYVAETDRTIGAADSGAGIVTFRLPGGGVAG